MNFMQTDIAIVGGGPAGYVAAITAAQKQKRVVLVEESSLGGTCLNKGCIPTKVLAGAGALYALLKRSKEFGFDTGEPVINWPRIQERKEETVSTLRRGVEGLLRARKIEVIRGKGRLLGLGRISISAGSGTSALRADNIIIASGSASASFPFAAVDEKDILSSNGILELPELPKSLAVIGGGVIGLEFASIYSLLGVKVTVVELLSRILDGILDPEAAGMIARELQKRGVEIHTGARVDGIHHLESGKVRVSFAQSGGDRKITAEKVLIAAGRVPRTDGLGLDDAGVGLNGKAVKVNSRLETGVPGIYAAGDVTGGYMLAHVASAEGATAALNAVGIRKEMNYLSIPSCLYTCPEAAQVGLSEDEARKKYGKLKIGKFPLSASGKALIDGEVSGFVKIISDPKYGEILGVTIVGGHATELIAEAGLAISSEMTVEQIIETIHAHPTVAEAVREAALAAAGVPLHIL